MSERLRWKLWGLITRLPRACPANAHMAIVTADIRRDGLRTPFIDHGCRNGLTANGSCYCGKLRR